MWASGAVRPRPTFFYALYMLERAISLIFGLVVQTHSKKSLPPFSKIKKVHALSPSIVQILEELLWIQFWSISSDFQTLKFLMELFALKF